MPAVRQRERLPAPRIGMDHALTAGSLVKGK